MSHVTHMKEICHTHEWVIVIDHMKSKPHLKASRHMHASCHTYESVMSWHTCKWIVFLRPTSASLYLRNDSLMCVSIICVHTQRMAHIWMSHVTHMNESCLEYKWVISHTWLCHITRMNMKEVCHTHEWVLAHTWMRHVTHMYESCHTHVWVVAHKIMSYGTNMNEP